METIKNIFKTAVRGVWSELEAWLFAFQPLFVFVTNLVDYVLLTSVTDRVSGLVWGDRGRGSWGIPRGFLGWPLLVISMLVILPPVSLHSDVYLNYRVPN